MTTSIPVDDLAVNTPEAVIKALAQEVDSDPLELPPLGESLNPIALELLLEDDFFTGQINFEYDGHEVTVSSEDIITIT